jgi:hypothetical protein
VIAANFAFDQANKKNIYDEYEDEIKPDLWDDLDEEEVDINDIEVDAEVVKAPEDWKVVDENNKEIKNKRVTKVLQKTPSKRRVKFSDGSQGWIDKGDENKIVYL